MSEIQQLNPTSLWKWFDQICAIPHPSHHEDALANFIVNWAKEKNFFVERDEVGNVLIRKPATKGMEHMGTTILQRLMKATHMILPKILFNLILTGNG